MRENGPKPNTPEPKFQIEELRSRASEPRTRPDFALPPDHPLVRSAIELRRYNDRVGTSGPTTEKEVFRPGPLRDSRNESRERPDFTLPPDHPKVKAAIRMSRYNNRRE